MSRIPHSIVFQKLRIIFNAIKNLKIKAEK